MHVWPRVQGLLKWGLLAAANRGQQYAWPHYLPSVALSYRYPQHHDLSSWEARCKCLAAMLCCKANITRRPDGKRAPLTNIAELTAGAAEDGLHTVTASVQSMFNLPNARHQGMIPILRLQVSSLTATWTRRI